MAPRRTHVISLASLALMLTGACGTPTVLKVSGHTLRTFGGWGGGGVTLRGTNLGGWLVQENWMAPLESGNELGDGHGDEWTLRQVLDQRFGASATESLIAAYQDTWIQTCDLDNIEATGLNLVRVPIYYLDLMDETGAWRSNPWSRLDWLVRECGQRRLYVLLDLHGAPGSQNGAHHSGRTTASPELWTSLAYQDMTNVLWQEIARHFQGQSIVAGYDLLNEPSRPSSVTDEEFKAQLNSFYDRLYRTIRAVDPDHIIFLESFPGWDMVDPPSTHGWKNVVYEFHSYAMGVNEGGLCGRIDCSEVWSRQYDMVNEVLNKAQELQRNYDVPVYFWEFNLFRFDDQWRRLLAGLNALDVSWSPWTYKVTGGNPADGDFAENWGLYIHATTTRPNVVTDDAATIEAEWRAFDTATHFTPNDGLIEILRSYTGGSTSVPPGEDYYSIRHVASGQYVCAEPAPSRFLPLATTACL